MSTNSPHYYVERKSGRIHREKFLGDGPVGFLYSRIRENAPSLYRLLVSRRASGILAVLNCDIPIARHLIGSRSFFAQRGLDLGECVEPPESLKTWRSVFERRIRYWECRPLPQDPAAIVSPADAKVLVGSFCHSSSLFLKGKFFDYEELFGLDKREWLRAFCAGDVAVCRLTPENYHYNHTPVSGRVRDFYSLEGLNHSCNPSAVVAVATPYSKNARTITIIDTDVSGGTQAGFVAMIEVSALMVGRIVQCYSRSYYNDPKPVEKGMFVERGCPKSQYRPGSSTDVLVFQRDRIRFEPDLIRNSTASPFSSRYSNGLGGAGLETDVEVRSKIATTVRLS
jgi:phosphatidylserine decarboxylase